MHNDFRNLLQFQLTLAQVERQLTTQDDKPEDVELTLEMVREITKRGMSREMRREQIISTIISCMPDYPKTEEERKKRREEILEILDWELL